jgi:hypothetical protein
MVIGPEHVRICLLPHSIMGCCNSCRPQPRASNSKSGPRHRNDMLSADSMQHNYSREEKDSQPFKKLATFCGIRSLITFMKPAIFSCPEPDESLPHPAKIHAVIRTLYCLVVTAYISPGLNCKVSALSSTEFTRKFRIIVRINSYSFPKQK